MRRRTQRGCAARFRDREMRAMFVVVLGLAVAGPIVAAQEPVLRRDTARPGVVVVSRLDKDRPFLAVLGDLLRIQLEPQAPRDMPYVKSAGMKIIGVPGLRTVVEREPFSIEWDTAAYSPGSYRLRAVSILPNKKQLVADAVEVVLLKGEPVSVTVPESPNPRAKVPIRVEAKQGYSFRRAEVIVDGEPAGDIQPLPGELALDPAQMSGGPHQLLVRLTDDGGREYLSRPIQFSIPELVHLVEPTEGQAVYIGGGGAEVRFRAEHSLGDAVKTVEFYTDGLKVGEAFQAPLEFVWRNAPLSPGRHRVFAVALEETGGVFRSREITIEASTVTLPAGPTRANITAKITPAVVLVEAEGKDGEEGRSAASGFLIDASGYIVTSRHVTEGSEKIYVTPQRGQRILAQVVARHPSEDVAVIRVPPGNYAAMPLGRDSDAEVGLEIGAAGFPFARDLSKLELGVVPAFNYGTISAIRPTRDRSGTATTVIHFDARIAPGQSGGPLFNASTGSASAGKVLGVVRSGLVSESMGATGINLAVRVDVLRSLLVQSRIPFREEWAP